MSVLSFVKTLSEQVLRCMQPSIPTEPLTDPRNKRYALYPIHYPSLFKRYKDGVRSFWTVEEVDLSKDRADYETLTESEQRFVKQTFAFFAVSDGIVMENLACNFATEFVVPEIRHYYAQQEFIESIHSEMYSLLIETVVADVSERENLYDAVRTHPCISRKAAWAREWMDASRPLGERLVAFACVEGIHFSSSFACLFWLKTKGLMPGATFSNELISRDEGMHRDFAVEVTGLLQHRPTDDRIEEIIRSAVDVEQAYVRDILRDPVLGLSSTQMQQYVEVVADNLIQSFGLESVFGTRNPFQWMEMICMDGKTNFFEKRVSEYQKHDGAVSCDQMNFDLTTF